MEKRIELDETKVLEIQQTNLQLMTKADRAIADLEAATAKKDFSPIGESLLAEVEFHGKELTRAINWWEKDFIGPVVTTAYDLWKMLCARRAAIGEPLEEKKRRAARAVGAYRAAHEQDRYEREERERKRLEKIEEDKRLAEAVELEKNGKKDEAQELVDTPVFTPPVTFAAPAKTKGVGERGNWRFEITNAALVPDQFWMINESALGAQVRIYKGKVEIPGVRAWFEPSASFSVK